jgi:hypothetical protein
MTQQGSAQRHEDQDLDIKHQEGEAEAFRLIAVDKVILRARAQAVRDAQTKHKKETQMIRELVQENFSLAAKCK